MPRVEFKIEDLKDFDDGQVFIALQEEIRAIIADCQQRPGLKKARKTAFAIVAEPITKDSGGIVEVEVTFAISSSLPKRESIGYRFETDRGGKLVYNKNSPSDLKQGHIDDEIEKKGK